MSKVIGGTYIDGCIISTNDLPNVTCRNEVTLRGFDEIERRVLFWRVEETPRDDYIQLASGNYANPVTVKGAVSYKVAVSPIYPISVSEEPLTLNPFTIESADLRTLAFPNDSVGINHFSLGGILMRNANLPYDTAEDLELNPFELEVINMRKVVIEYEVGESINLTDMTLDSLELKRVVVKTESTESINLTVFNLTKLEMYK